MVARNWPGARFGCGTMAIAQAKRRLAAIMAADIVGYSGLIEQDEAGTLAAIRDLRQEVIDPLLAGHHGRIVKLMGDGAIVEFGSVVDAVACAADIQKRVAEEQAEVPPDRRIVYRIGVNLGDVVVDGDDLLGDGVNVAARLEQLCEPGGVLVSGTAYDHLPGKLDLPLDDAGEQQLKNIARPVRIWRLRLDGAKPQRLRTRKRNLGSLIPIASAALIALVLTGGAWWWFRPLEQATGPPAIAVLPFTNMSGDPAQDYLGAGVAEDIITLLSTFPTLRVVSRLSSFTYDKPVKIQEVGRDLGVRYVVEGSVRRTADKVRVTAQLIDAKTGDHVWANRFDDETADVVALQEEVATKIYGSLAGLTGTIREDEEQISWQKSAPSLDEYDYYLRGHDLFFRFTPEDNLRAQKVWQAGLAKYPGSALLRIKLAFTYLEPIVELWIKPSESDLDAAWRLGKEAEASQDKSRLEIWLCHWLMAQLYQWHEEDFDRSVAEAEATIEMVPYDGLSRSILAGNLANAGKTDQAIEWAEEAIRRAPNSPDGWQGNLAWAYYMAGRPEDALAALQKVAKPYGDMLAAVYARLGRIAEARAVMAEFVKDTGYTIEDEARWPLIQPLEEGYLDDLRKAGMPER
jgi:TolB-like protein/class 3 adenylate cyclase